MSIDTAASCPRQTGLTLIELIIFIVVIGVGLVGILSVMNVTVRGSADPMIRKQAISFAESVLEEVLTKSYADKLAAADTAPCANRPAYIGVDDYACFSGSPASAVIRGDSTLGGTSIAALASYQATVTVTPASVNGLTLKRIVVTVTGGGETIQLRGYRANY